MTDQCCPCEGLTSPCCEFEEITCCILDTSTPFAEGGFSGLITNEHLPPSIILNGITLSSGNLSYGDTINGAFLEGTFGTESYQWVIYKNGVRSSRRCLISDTRQDILDTFPQSVFATYSYAGATVSNTLTRDSLCGYSAKTPPFLILFYGGGPLNSTLNTWYLAGPFIAEREPPLPPFVGAVNFSRSVNNQPAGNYSMGAADQFGAPVTITATVTAAS